MDETYETIVLGGGPAGLTAGIYLVRAGIKTLVVEKQMIGGAPMNTEHIENYPGFPDGVSGRELMARMGDQARNVGVVIGEFSQIHNVRVEADHFISQTDGASYRTAGVIVATGTESTKLGIPGEDQLVGRGISYCATCDGMFFRGLEVAVVGGGDSALSEALTLANIASKVYVIHRREQFRAQQVLQDRIAQNDRIKLLLNKAPIRINGGNQVDSMTLKDTVTGSESDLVVSGIFFYVGSKPDTGFVGELVERDGAGFIVTDEGLATQTIGLFAAGDVRKKTLRQITTAVGDGALAAVNLEKYILEKR
jgi:thioredoxin reductase (NADPH)